MKLINSDCLLAMKSMPDDSVDAIITDPPYFKVKGDAWDNQWENSEQFLSWMDLISSEWKRILKPKGSLYCFASPKMSSKIEVMLSKKFNVLNNIRWDKTNNWGYHIQIVKDSLRSFFPAYESIIFCEQPNSDKISKWELWNDFVFESLRKYLYEEMIKSWWNNRMVDKEWQKIRNSKGQMAGHWFWKSQWQLPLAEQYQWLRSLFNNKWWKYLRREYESLRREYESLRREYESLRRQFSVTKEVPFTDTWNFKPVKSYKWKHPCEKPQELLRHIIRCSTRPGDIVLDSFMWTWSTGIACKEEGRNFIGIEMSPEYLEIAKKRISSIS